MAGLKGFKALGFGVASLALKSSEFRVIVMTVVVLIVMTVVLLVFH